VPDSVPKFPTAILVLPQVRGAKVINGGMKLIFGEPYIFEKIFKIFFREFLVVTLD
jgi:hypothetical protein